MGMESFLHFSFAGSLSTFQRHEHIRKFHLGSQLECIFPPKIL
jgi:hypothetical protein